MNKLLKFVAGLVLFAVVACGPSDLTPTPTPETPFLTPSSTKLTPVSPTATEQATNTPVASETAVSVTPTQTATGVPTPTVLPTDLENVFIPLDAPNLVANPTFDGPVRSIVFNEINVINSYFPYYAAYGYLGYQDEFFADRRDTESPARPGFNEPTLRFGRPEYKYSTVSNRVRGGTGQSQVAFNNYRIHDGGIYQPVQTLPGAVCEVGIYLQVWSTKTGSLASDLDTQDDRDNYTARIRVDLTGKEDAYAPHVLVSRPFGFNDGIYDKFALIKYRFVATSNITTVFWGVRTLWPFGNNDAYYDDAYVRCTDWPDNEPPLFPTPTQIGPGVTQTPDVTVGCTGFPCKHRAEQIYIVTNALGLNVRSDYVVNSYNVVGVFSKGDELDVRCIIETDPFTFWGSLLECQPHPNRWFLIQTVDREYAKELEGPEG